MIEAALPIVTNRWAFYLPATVVVGYILYMMIRRRRPERVGGVPDEPEL